MTFSQQRTQRSCGGKEDKQRTKQETKSLTLHWKKINKTRTGKQSKIKRTNITLNTMAS